MKTPIQPNEWHYPACQINDYTNVHDRCPHRMYEQIQNLRQEYSILAKQKQHLRREVTRLEAEVRRLEQIATQ
jgi:hypothetical protein